MTTLRTSKDRRTTAENPAFVAYVFLHIAEEMRAAGNPAYEIAELLGASGALRHGKMPPGVFVPEEDFRTVYNGAVEALKAHAAKVLLERASDGPKH